MQIDTVAALGKEKEHHARKLSDRLAQYQASIGAKCQHLTGNEVSIILADMNNAKQKAQDDRKVAAVAQKISTGSQNEDV